MAFEVIGVMRIVSADGAGIAVRIRRHPTFVAGPIEHHLKIEAIVFKMDIVMLRENIDSLERILGHLREITDTTDQLQKAGMMPVEWNERLALDITTQLLDAQFRKLQVDYMLIRDRMGKAQVKNSAVSS